MPEVTARKLIQLPYVRGEHAVPGLRFHLAGRELGVTAWGMNVLALDPGCAGHPEHDHAEDGQEEVYVVLGGSGQLVTGDVTTTLGPGVMVRIGPTTKRKLVPGDQGLVVLALGGLPREG